MLQVVNLQPSGISQSNNDKVHELAIHQHIKHSMRDGDNKL